MEDNQTDLICPGFRAAGIAAGIKKTNEPDLALIVNDTPVGAAALFTENRVKAAPVLLTMERMAVTTTRAVLINSGGANACTGRAGIEDARRLTRLVAEKLGLDDDAVVPASTGVIGERLPVGGIAGSLDRLVADLSPDGMARAARAIMTTDTRPKCLGESFSARGREYRLVGIAKGAGMIFPHLATLLAFAVTDFPVAGRELTAALAGAAARSFNAVTIDGDTSTNDTVLVMSGDPGRRTAERGPVAPFSGALARLFERLAREIVMDAEGATKFVAVTVRGAPGRGVARKTAFRVANSPLVKTAIFGQDPNWGRIVGAVGCIAGRFDPARADVFIGDVPVAAGGIGCGPDREEAARSVMRGREYTITIDLHAGRSSFTAYTCDLSIDYVKINADYRS
jgi:glutamate N-acetyltransferase/amino-acid N-acetyltransferase